MGTHNYNHLLLGREMWKTYNGDQDPQQTLLERQGVHIQKYYVQWFKYFYWKAEILQLLEENIDHNLQGVRVGRDFLNRTSVAQELGPTTDNWN